MQIAFVSVLRNGRPKGCETLLDDVRKHVREADFLHCALLDFFLSFTLFFFFFAASKYYQIFQSEASNYVSRR